MIPVSGIGSFSGLYPKYRNMMMSGEITEKNVLYEGKEGTATMCGSRAAARALRPGLHRINQ